MGILQVLRSDFQKFRMLKILNFPPCVLHICLFVVPLSVLILGPNKPDHEHYYKESKGGDLCDNVTYLGKLKSAK